MNPPNVFLSSAPGRRQSNLELLRILSMIMIIILHFMSHGKAADGLRLFSGAYFYCWILKGFSRVANDCYLLISGYFLIDKNFSLKKLLLLTGQVFFYSAGIYLVLSALGLIDYSPLEAVKTFFPITTGQYWFATAYVQMYILSPFLNKAIRALNKLQHTACIAVLLLLYSFLPRMIDFFFLTGGMSWGGGNASIVWFVILYLIAAYIKLYYKPNGRPGRYLPAYFVFAFMPSLFKFGVMVLYTKVDSLREFVSHVTTIDYWADILFTDNALPVAAAAVLLFLIFLNIDIRQNRINRAILFLAPLTFGVYLIHNNSSLYSIYWPVINAPAHVNEWYFPFFYVGVNLGIYLVCSAVEWLRKLLFHGIETSRWLDRGCRKAEQTAADAFARCLRRISGGADN